MAMVNAPSYETLVDRKEDSMNFTYSKWAQEVVS